MRYNRFGKSDLVVSEIGMGCMSLLGGDTKENRAIIQRAFDAGINYFDTADLYEKGENEILLGEAVQSFRQDIVLATKVGNCWKADGSGWDWNPSKSYILKEVENSLIRLKTDYIDLYQLHGGTKDDPRDEIIEAFESLVQSGKIRYYGISSIRPNVFLKYAQDSAICANMMQYSLLDRRPEPYFDDLSSANVSVIARGSLAQGLLLDKPVKAYLDYSPEEIKRVQDTVKIFAGAKNISTQAVALSYVLTNSEVSSAIVGVSSLGQLKELLQAKSELITLTEEELSQVIDGLGEIAYRDHLV